MKWNLFDPEKGCCQKLPKIGKYVLLEIAKPSDIVYLGKDFLLCKYPSCLAVGYLKNAAGDKNYPRFIVPGFPQKPEVVSWNDCLSEDFSPPIMQ